MSSADNPRPPGPPTTPPASDRIAAFWPRETTGRWMSLAMTLGLLLVAGAGWTIAWQFVAVQAKANVENWIDQRRAFGDRIQHGPLQLGGFPFTVEITAGEVHWAREDGPTLLTAAAPEVVASVVVWDPMTMTVRPTGGARASAAGSWGSVTGDAELAIAVLELGPWAPHRIDLTLRNLDLTGPGGILLGRVDAVEAMFNPTPKVDAVAGSVPTTLTAEIHASGVHPAGADRLPFEGPASFTLAAALRGPVDPGAGVPGLALWRDAGGVIDIDQLTASWSPVDLIGDGSFALDAALRLQGAATAEIRGLAETLDRLADKGRMTPGQAALLKLGIIAASEPVEGGGQGLRAPITVQDGTVRIGRIAVAKVGPLLD